MVLQSLACCLPVLIWNYFNSKLIQDMRLLSTNLFQKFKNSKNGGLPFQFLLFEASVLGLMIGNFFVSDYYLHGYFLTYGIVGSILDLFPVKGIRFMHDITLKLLRFDTEYTTLKSYIAGNFNSHKKCCLFQSLFCLAKSKNLTANCIHFS